MHQVTSVHAKPVYHVLQFLTDTVCDMEFNPKYPDLLVTSGKEHLQWWKVYPDSGELHPFTVPDYEVYSHGIL